MVKSHLCCRSEGFNYVFERISVYPVKKIEDLDRDLCISEKQGINVPLLQVFGDRVIVGEVPMVHKGLIETDKGVGASWMPHAAPGGKALVSYPYVGVEVVQLVVIGYLFCVSHDLHDHHVPAVGEDKSFLLT